MGWIRDLLSPDATTIKDAQPQREERFPRHTYGAGFPIIVHLQELDELTRLLELDSNAPDGWDNLPFLSREDFEEIVDDTIGDFGDGVPSPEERRGEIREIVETWQDQITGSEDAVWTTVGTDLQFKFYIDHCTFRADAEDDDFEEPDELNTAREILNRIQTARDSDAKRAVVHKRHLPLEEPGEDASETS